ncbi:hypothetical protein M0805_006588 [Coniferiporia weirii]|nr:hypothetical protein M0805_006588 [Coniferiporia weirii]
MSKAEVTPFRGERFCDRWTIPFLRQIQALQLANEHRNAYGLRYNDYNRYRNHCRNRTHRLRSTLKMTHGKGRDFKKLPLITLENIKAGHLQLLLFETERAWAYSQELYTSSLQPANKDNAAKLRHSATGRFRRAIHWCTQLLSHCQNLYAAQRFSSENMVEVNAYTLILSGRFLRFRDEFEDGLEQLCVARDLLDHLADCAESSRDQALATLFSDEISPEIRYCAHQLGHANSYNVDHIVSEVSPKHRTVLAEGYDQLIKRLGTEVQRSSNIDRRLRELVWEGLAVPVRNPELVDVLLAVQNAETQLQTGDETSKLEAQAHASSEKREKRQNRSRKGVAAFDAILAVLSDAEGVARKLIEAQRTDNGPTGSSNGSRDIHFLHAYIVYQLLSRRIERDLTLISALVSSSKSQRKQPEKTGKRDTRSSAPVEQTDARVNPAVVKLLDTILQSLNHMRSLSIVDENPDLANAVEARLAFTKSRRCLYLARSYAAVKQYAQSLSLLQRVYLYIREASSLLSTSSDPINTASPSFYFLSSDTVTDMERSHQTDETYFRREWFTFNGGSVELEKDTLKKPLFFDVALNYVQLDMDSLQERAGINMKSSAPQQTSEPRSAPIAKARVEGIERTTTPEPSVSRGGGLSTLLGGWWGRK